MENLTVTLPFLAVKQSGDLFDANNIEGIANVIMTTRIAIGLGV